MEVWEDAKEGVESKEETKDSKVVVRLQNAYHATFITSCLEWLQERWFSS